MGLIRPILFLGGHGVPTLLQANTGYTDDGNIYELIAQSVPLAPAGPHGDASWSYVYLTTRHYATDVSFWLTAFLDTVQISTQRIDLVGLGVNPNQGWKSTHVLSLMQVFSRDGINPTRTYAPRGTWFQLQLQTLYAQGQAGAAAAAARQILESAEVEYDAYDTAKVPANAGVSTPVTP